MRKLLNDQPMRTAIGASGQRLVAENYTWAKCAASYLDVYRSCFATAGRIPYSV